jgi:hypothetical protein
VPGGGADALLFAGVAVFAACVLYSRLSAVWTLLAGKKIKRAAAHTPPRPTYPTSPPHLRCGIVLLIAQPTLFNNFSIAFYYSVIAHQGCTLAVHHSSRLHTRCA